VQDEKPIDLGMRTKEFARRIVKLFVALPKKEEARVIGRQFLRSGTSVGAHYREARRSRSGSEFVSKIELALQELDETSYWLELLIDCGLMSATRLRTLQTEACELLAIFTTIARKKKGEKGRMKDEIKG
jgi:four helix bundle protein